MLAAALGVVARQRVARQAAALVAAAAALALAAVAVVGLAVAVVALATGAVAAVGGVEHHEAPRTRAPPGTQVPPASSATRAGPPPKARPRRVGWRRRGVMGVAARGAAVERRLLHTTEPREKHEIE